MHDILNFTQAAFSIILDQTNQFLSFYPIVFYCLFVVNVFVVIIYIINEYDSNISIKQKGLDLSLNILSVNAFLFSLAIIFYFSIFYIYLACVMFYSSYPITQACVRYLTLTTILLFITYMPERGVGFRLCRFIDYFSNFIFEISLLIQSYLFKKHVINTKPPSFWEFYRNSLGLLRFKLWVYFASFLMVVILSVEDFSQKVILDNILWKEYKPVLIQSVITVITFDRFINIWNEEWSQIRKDVTKVIEDARIIRRGG